MNALLKAACALAIVGTATLGSVLPAQADWHWKSPHYHNGYFYYGYYYPSKTWNNDPGGVLPVSAFGFVPPAGVSTVSDHVWHCQQRYHSYNESTDSFTGRGGRHYLCRL